MFRSLLLKLQDRRRFPSGPTELGTGKLDGSPRSRGWAEVEDRSRSDPLSSRSAIGQRFSEAAVDLARGEKLDSLNL